MTKNERIEILMKELSEISAILNSIKETNPISKTLVTLAAEKSYYFGRKVTMMLNDSVAENDYISGNSNESDKELGEDFFAESEVENIFLQPELSYSTRISTNPGDITPWMPDSDQYNDIIADDNDSIPETDVIKNEDFQEETPIKEESENIVNDNISETDNSLQDLSSSVHLDEDSRENNITEDIESNNSETAESLSEHLADNTNIPEFVEDLVRDAESLSEEEPEKPLSLENELADVIVEDILKDNIEVCQEPEKVNENQKKAFESLFRKFPQEVKVSSTLKNDIRKLLSLNDRFLFQRELFKGDVGLMNYTFDELNGLETFEDALEYLQSNFKWDKDSTQVREFMNLVERHFTGKII